jgi:hypothetical protein
MCCSTAFWTAMFSGEKPTVHFMEDGIKDIEEGAWF